MAAAATSVSDGSYSTKLGEPYPAAGSVHLWWSTSDEAPSVVIQKSACVDWAGGAPVFRALVDRAEDNHQEISPPMAISEQPNVITGSMDKHYDSKHAKIKFDLKTEYEDHEGVAFVAAPSCAVGLCAAAVIGRLGCNKSPSRIHAHVSVCVYQAGGA
jgi:hypothetical protein